MGVASEDIQNETLMEENGVCGTIHFCSRGGSFGACFENVFRI